MQLEYSDSEDDNPNDVEVNDDTRLTYDKPRILEPFEGSPGIKIMPISPKNIILQIYSRKMVIFSTWWGNLIGIKSQINIK